MSDIKFINGKYYDFSETNNPTFTMTAKELKNLGIKNYYFMLEIKNPRVADIDPFKKNITRQEIEALTIEYRENMWWFLRTAVKMRTDAGIVHYGLHRGLAAVCWNFLRHQDNCITEPRQTWKTTGTIGGPILWAFQFSQNMKVQFFGKETSNTKRNLQHLKSNVEILPEWCRFTRYMTEDGKVKNSRRSTEILQNNLFHNEIIIHPKPTSLSHAQGMARGDSGAILYFDEIEFMPFFGEVLSNSAPLFKTASENAAKSGQPYCRLFSTTPGNLDTKEGREAMPIIQAMIPWSEKLYDMTEEEIMEYKAAYQEQYDNSEDKHDREVVDIFYMEYQYYQVRKDWNWVLEQYKLSGDKMAIRREILMQRLRGSTESPIDPEDIEYLISNMKKAKKEIIICNKWLFKIYDHGAGLRAGRPKDLDENIPYIVGIDPAGGGGGDKADFFAITVLNPYNLQVAAEFKNRYVSGPQAVRMLQELVRDYIPKAVLIPEKNSMGIYLIQMLLETELRENMYWNRAKQELESITEYGPDDYQLKSMAKQYQKYGTYLVGKTRDAAIELLFQYIRECKQVLCTEYLVDDICKLVKTSTGRIEAVKGEHDDCLFSWLHAIYIYHTGDNLDTFGIHRQENPVWSKIESPETEEDIIIESNAPVTEITSYDEFVMQDAMRMEGEIKELVNTLPFVHDEIYKREEDNPLKESVESIDPWFFDMVNDIQLQF